MSASKRDFTDFYSFPGSLNEGTGIYEFPTVVHKDDANRSREWTIYVRLVKDGERQNEIDWNLLSENQVPIKDEYFTSATISDNIIAEAWAETGITSGKITRSIPTYFDHPAFVGQSNERNVFQQALIYARAQYIKRKD